MSMFILSFMGTMPIGNIIADLSHSISARLVRSQPVELLP